MSDWTSLEDWTRAYVRALTRRDIAAGLERLNSDSIRAAITQDSIAAGDALIPTNVAASIGMVSLRDASLRALCTQWPMTSAAELVPALYDDDHSGGAPFGVDFDYVQDGTSQSDGDPEWQQIRLDSNEPLIATTTIHNPLVEDSAPAFAAAMERVFGEALDFDIERQIIRGTGTVEFLGILNAEARITESRGTANQIARADLDNMLSRLLPGCFRSAVWIAHPHTLPQIGAISESAVQGPDRDSYAIDGRRLIMSEHCSTLGTSGDIILMDPRAYYIGNRAAFTVSLSPHPEFRTTRTVLKAKARIAGSPGISSSITPAQDAATSEPLSAFVTL